MTDPKKPYLKLVEDDEDDSDSSGGTSTSAIFINTEEEDDSGSGSVGGAGSGQPLIDPALFGLTNHLLLEQIRKGEAQFGRVPFTEDPSRKNRAEGGMGKGMQTHPLFLKTQQFAGIPPDNSPSPPENPDAESRMQEEFQNRLQLAARPQNKKAPPKLTR